MCQINAVAAKKVRYWPIAGIDVLPLMPQNIGLAKATVKRQLDDH
jgi:hypothetical protein